MIDWEKAKSEISFAMKIVLFLWPIGAGTLAIYHHMVLFPMLEKQYTPIIEEMIADAQTKNLGMDQVDDRIKEWVKAALHTALLTDVNHLNRSYIAIPDPKKQHQVIRMKELEKDQAWHQKHYDRAEEKGLVLPVFPPP